MSDINPYVGPRSFRYGEKLWGRDQEIADVRDLLIAERILLLYSPSGAGKSSLMEAGIRPELERVDFDVLPTVRVGYETADGALAGRPDPTRNRYTASALMSLEEGRPAADRMGEELERLTLEQYLDRRRDEAASGKDQCVFFDQFEELFTLDPTDLEAKAQFLAEVGVALRDRNRWALFAMREDFIAQLDPYLGLVPKRFAARYRLDLLGVQAATVAVRRPAAERRVDITEEATVQLVDDLRTVRVQRGGSVTEELGPYVEPVQLQVVCRRLWDSVMR